MLVDKAADVAALLTTASMATLGIDIRVVARAGLRLTGVVTVSLLVQSAISLALIRVLSAACRPLAWDTVAAMSRPAHRSRANART